MTSRKTGVSLMELLVVVALVALLMSLILPAINQARARSQALGCLNNLRQWGQATLQFALEHNDLLPKDGAPNGTSVREGWYVDLPMTMGLAPYMEQPWRTNAGAAPPRSVWICPANPRRSNGHNLFHYCLNQNVNRTGRGRQIPLTAIAKPDVAVWMFDNGKLAAVAQQNNVHTNLHDRGAQFVFLDGHVDRLNAREYWDFTANRGLTNHPALDWYP